MSPRSNSDGRQAPDRDGCFHLWKRGNMQQRTKLCRHLGVVALAHQRRQNRLGAGGLLQCAAFAGHQQEAKKRDGIRDVAGSVEERDAPCDPAGGGSSS